MGITRTPYTYPGGAISVAVDDDPGYGCRPDLWPSVGEYPVYDPFLYLSLTGDAIRNTAFTHALGAAVPGRRVIDIGTGQDLLWGLNAARLGAEHVVAIEAIPDSHAAAEQRRISDPHGGRVELIHGLSYDLELPQRAEVCVAELIGSIASAEGMLPAMADAHARLLAPGAVVVPAACSTVAAAICLRSLFPDGLAFSIDAVPYLHKIFEANGGPFDVRLAIAAPDPDCLASTAAVVESLRFDAPQELDGRSTARLVIKKAGPVDGLLFWIRLDAGAGARILDSLHDRTSWIPAYLPLFEPPILAAPGDELTVQFERRTCDDGVHPDYAVEGTLITGGQTFRGSFLSAYRGTALGTAAVYRELLAPDPPPQHGVSADS